MNRRALIANPEFYAAMGRATRALAEANARLKQVVPVRRPTQLSRRELWNAQIAIAQALRGDAEGLRSALAALAAEEVRRLGVAGALLAREAAAVQEEET